MSIQATSSRVMPPPLRKHLRINVEGRVFIHNEDQLFSAPISDISEGGVFLSNLTQLSREKEVFLVIKITGFRPIQARGNLLRVQTFGEKPGSAIQFTELTDENRQILLVCLSRKLIRTFGHAE